LGDKRDGSADRLELVRTMNMNKQNHHILQMPKMVAIRIAALVSLLLVVAYISTVQPSGIDFWLQAMIGDLIYERHSIPQSLEFPFTEIADQAFNAHEWLVSVGFGVLVKLVGVEGLTYVLTALGLVYFLLACYLGYVRSQKNVVAALLVGALAVMAENYRHVLRPELITLFIMIIYWILLEKMKNEITLGTIAFSSILVVAWANSHGSFVLAIVLPGIYAAGLYADQVWANRALCLPSKKSLIFAALTVLAIVLCMINPFGWKLYKFVFQFSNDAQAATHVTEWIPTLDSRFRHMPAMWIFGLIWLMSITVLVLDRRNVSFVGWLIFIFFTYLSLKAIRFPVYLGVVLIFLTAPFFGRLFGDHTRQYFGYIFIFILGVLALCLSVKFKNLQGSSPISFGTHKLSDQMVLALKDERRHGNVLNSMEMGAELIYWAYPRMRPASDCRVDSYGFEYLNYLSAVLVSDDLLTEFVSRYDVRYILIDAARFNSFVMLNAWKQHKWEVVLLDGRAAFLRRHDVSY
jgi:hypothetical protein